MSQIRWKADVDRNFDTAADWSNGTVPGAGDDVVMTQVGPTPYTVTASDSHTIDSLTDRGIATLAITAGTFTITDTAMTSSNAGTIAVGDGASLAIDGGFTNTKGTISLSGAADATTFSILAVGATLSGGGQILLSDSSANTITGAAGAVLTNVDNTIAGAGCSAPASSPSSTTRPASSRRPARPTPWW